MDENLIEELRRYADSAKRGAPAPERLLRAAADKIEKGEVFENYFWKFCPDIEAYFPDDD